MCNKLPLDFANFVIKIYSPSAFYYKNMIFKICIISSKFLLIFLCYGFFGATVWIFEIAIPWSPLFSIKWHHPTAASPDNSNPVQCHLYLSCFLRLSVYLSQLRAISQGQKVLSFAFYFNWDRLMFSRGIKACPWGSNSLGTNHCVNLPVLPGERTWVFDPLGNELPPVEPSTGEVWTESVLWST